MARSWMLRHITPGLNNGRTSMFAFRSRQDVRPHRAPGIMTSMSDYEAMTPRSGLHRQGGTGQFLSNE